MLRGQSDAAALRAADHERHRGLATQHVPDLRRLVHHLVHGHRDEIPDLDLDDGPHPGHRRAHAHADERRLGDGSIAHAVLAEAVTESLGDLEDPADQPHVLAHEEHALVARHLAVQGGVQRLAERLLAAGAARGLGRARMRRVDRRLHDLDGGLRALAAVGDRGIQLAFHPLAHLFQVDITRAQVHQPLFDAGDRVLLHPLELFLLGAVVGQVGAHAVPAPAVGDGFDAARTLTAPRARDGLTHGVVDGDHVVAVHAGGRDAVRPGAGRYPLARRGARLVGGERVLVVLADEDEWKLPHRGQVHGLVDHALVGAAVAEEGQHDAVRAPELGGEGGAGADGHAGRHDAIGAQHVEVERGDVHGAAEAPAVTVLAPHQLGHHEVEARALGDAVAVAAVVADDGVVLRQVCAGAGGDRFLPDVAVGGALDLTRVEELHRLLVEAADADHHLVERLERLAAQWHV